jgi:hypothetical protein
MKKLICLLFAASIYGVAVAQYIVKCGGQTFAISAKKITPVKQVDPQTAAITNTSFYYQVDSDKLKVWMETGDSLTRSLSLYEIKKEAIDKPASQQIVDYDQQDYTEPVKTLYIKCAAGKKEVSVTGYVDWTNNADKFPWSFIYVSSYNRQELENMLTEINIWLKQ